MQDELVGTRLAAALLGIAMGLSGCNGCNGCVGQTIETTPALTNPGIDPALPSAIPSGARVAPAPSSMTSEAASALPNPEHDPTGVRRCCKAISENLGTAPDKHKATWTSALDACNQAIEKQTDRKGLQRVREILTSVGWPAACQ